MSAIFFTVTLGMVTLGTIGLAAGAKTYRNASWTLSWVIEHAFKEEANLLASPETEEWQLTVDAEQKRFCARKVRGLVTHYFRGGMQEHDGAWVTAQGGSYSMGISDWDSLFVFIPALGLTAVFPESDTVENLSAAGHAIARPHLALSTTQIDYRGFLTGVPWPVASQFDIASRRGGQLALSRWATIGFSDDPTYVSRTLQPCIAESLGQRSNSDVDAATHALQASLAERGAWALFDDATLAMHGEFVLRDGKTAHSQPREGGLLQKVWRWISTADGPRCPHYPTCSRYAADVTSQEGLLQSVLMTTQRMLSEGRSFEQDPAVRFTLHHGYWRVFDPVRQETASPRKL